MDEYDEDNGHPVLALLLLSLLGAGVYAMVRKQRGRLLYGVNTHLMRGRENASVVIQKAAAAKFRGLRDDGFAWPNVMPTTEFDWPFTDGLVAATAGFDMLGVLALAPTWANGKSDADWFCGAPPHAHYMPSGDGIGAYAYYCANVAARYKTVSAWEIWNEPNLYAFNPPVPSAALYTSLLRAGYLGVKQGNPSALVVGGVLGDAPSRQVRIDAWCGSYTQTDVAPDEFLQQMYDNGAKGSFDVLSMHIYEDVTALDRVRQVMLNNGDDKPIWVTEFGYSTCPNCLSFADQATRNVALLREIKRRPFVQRTYYYMLYDLDDCPDDPFCYSGLLTGMAQGHTAKPSYAAMQI